MRTVKVLGFIPSLAFAVACGNPTGSCGLDGCGSPCSQPTASQRWLPNYAVASDHIKDVNGALEGTMHVGEQASLLLIPDGGSNICIPSATWTSTSPKAASFKDADPTAGSVTEPFGSTVLYGVGPGDTTIHVVVSGIRYDLVYANLGERKISVIHVVP